MTRNFFAGLFLLLALVLIGTAGFDFIRGAGLYSDLLVQNLPVLIIAIINLLAFRYLRSRKSWKYRYLLSLFFALLISSMVTVFIGTTLYVDEQLKSRNFSASYANCHKVWGARGLVAEGPNITFNGSQNSIESISLAFSRGARGSEVDVYFDRELKQFIVSHDFPYNLKNGSILTLEQLFNAIGSDGYFWLDFKKLRRLNDEQLAQSVAELERISAKGDLKQRIYVEGEAPFSLAAYRDAGFNTIFDSHPVAESLPLAGAIINFYKIVFYFGNYTVMAMNYGELDDPIYAEHTRRLMADIPVFIYHLDDHADTLMMLAKHPPVRVILVENHSLDRYGVSSCSAEN